MALLAFAALGLAGCARPGTGSSGGPASSSASQPVSAHGCASTVNVGVADDGRTVCVAPGGVVTLSLAGKGWRAVSVTGTALTPKSASTTPDGEVAAFNAGAAGSARLTTSRRNCPDPSPGQVSCMSIQAFSVTVTIG